MSNFLIIGLGSMGKRRIRNLMDLGVKNSEIFGFDYREDRKKESVEKYKINALDSLENLNFDDIKAVIVSLPPDKHAEGVSIAQKHHKPVFIEASVVLDDVKRIKDNNPSDVFLAPSCTMIFHPMVQEIKKIIQSEKYGKVCNFSYHSGQFLPDWHPWESVNDFYVGNRLTGGAREIVPYELTWIIDILGFPKDAKGYFLKTRELGCDIEDSYACSLLYDNMIGTIIVDVVARQYVRNLVINLEKGQIQWRYDTLQIELYDAETNTTSYIRQGEFKHIDGYDKNLVEDMYTEEINSFLRGIDDSALFPNTIEKDIAVLEVLKKIEDSAGGF